jgi:hypothetical protein
MQENTSAYELLLPALSDVVREFSEMGIALSWSWFANMCARLELFTAGSATTENLPMKLEHGGSTERASISSSDL